MEIGKTLRVTTRKIWRTWLEKNHARKKGIWLVYATKQSGKGRVAYSDAVEEALCFGWIDGIMKGIDANNFSRNASAPSDIIAALKRDPQSWKNFQRFPKWYQRVRLGWLDASRDGPEIFRVRLRYFPKMTAQNKRYGMVK